MSFENSTPTAAPSIGCGEANANFNGVLAPGDMLTRPSRQSPSEIAGDGKSTKAKANKGASRDRMLELQKQKAELRAAGLMRSPLEKFIDDPRPLRAIRRFCYECNGYSLAAATNCENSNCPLWLFRRGSSIIQDAELPKWRRAYAAWMKAAGELDRVSDDIESGADESELLTDGAEG